LDLVSAAWFGVSGPRGLPALVVASLTQAIGDALREPRTVARFQELLGAAPPESTPDGFTSFVSSELTGFAPLVRAANLQPG
jgi:tripartite-type tricarboxylate transporter receptor subunit TctC